MKEYRLLMFTVRKEEVASEFMDEFNELIRRGWDPHGNLISNERRDLIQLFVREKEKDY